MYNNPASNCEYKIYPGGFIPLKEAEQVLHENKLFPCEAEKLPVNVDEFDDYFSVEILIPGAKREEIFVYTENCILKVAVIHKNPACIEKKLRVHEFEASCIERQIQLPENADTEFVSAEYREGILNLIIPKAGMPVNNAFSRIIVY